MKKDFNIEIISNFGSDTPDDSNFFPIISDEDSEIKKEDGEIENIPILPLRNTVLFQVL